MQHQHGLRVARAVGHFLIQNFGGLANFCGGTGSVRCTLTVFSGLGFGSSAPCVCQAHAIPARTKDSAAFPVNRMMDLRRQDDSLLKTLFVFPIVDLLMDFPFSRSSWLVVLWVAGGPTLRRTLPLPQSISLFSPFNCPLVQLSLLSQPLLRHRGTRLTNRI